jgi:hypothetical protein
MIIGTADAGAATASKTPLQAASSEASGVYMMQTMPYALIPALVTFFVLLL